MAKKPKTSRRKRRGNFVTIPFTTSLALSTLADEAVISADLLANAFGEDIYVLSIDASFSIRDLTGGEVPIRVGFAHGDLTDAEIAESLQAELTDPDDIIAKERSRRPVRTAGMFGLSAAEQVLADGNVKRVPMKFSVGNDHDIGVWAQNQSGATLTTGAIVECHGQIYGRWQR